MAADEMPEFVSPAHSIVVSFLSASPGFSKLKGSSEGAASTLARAGAESLGYSDGVGGGGAGLEFTSAGKTGKGKGNSNTARPSRLGLGAKFVTHKQVVATGGISGILQKKLERDKRKRERKHFEEAEELEDAAAADADPDSSDEEESRSAAFSARKLVATPTTPSFPGHSFIGVGGGGASSGKASTKKKQKKKNKQKQTQTQTQGRGQNQDQARSDGAAKPSEPVVATSPSNPSMMSRSTALGNQGKSSKTVTRPSELVHPIAGVDSPPGAAPTPRSCERRPKDATDGGEGDPPTPQATPNTGGRKRKRRRKGPKTPASTAQ